MTYWPASDKKVYPGIAATGREGVWRLLQFEYRTPLEDVRRGMENDTLYIQPESEGFILVELQSGIIINFVTCMVDIIIINRWHNISQGTLPDRHAN